MNKEIGKNIKHYRQINNISREVLSEKLDISVHTLAKYEQGQREATYETLNKICEILKISIHDIFGESSIDTNFYQTFYDDLHNITNTKKLIQLLFQHNDKLSQKLDLSTSSEKDKDYFYTIVSEFIDNELKAMSYLTMPFLGDD